MAPSETKHASANPISFSVAYPTAPLSRSTSLLRPLLAVPIVLLAMLLQGPAIPRGWSDIGIAVSGAFGGVGLVVVPVAAMLVIRRRYPQWWFAWNLELLRFVNRIVVYCFLMMDRYPSTEDQQAVRLDLPEPQPESMSRWLPLVKWLLALPHYCVLAPLYLLLPVVWLAAWVAIIATGTYPRLLFDYVEGVLRWTNRVTGYGYLLVTDAYPPFTLAP